MLVKNGLGLVKFGGGNTFRRIGGSKSRSSRFVSLFYEWSSVSHTKYPPQSTRKFHNAARSSCPHEPNSQKPNRSPLKDSQYASEKLGMVSEVLRKTMRNMPHSAVVVTSAQISLPPDTEPSSPLSKEQEKKQRQSFRGMTVSSFTTLTLIPEPIICFNVRAPSGTLDAIQESGQFLVHMLFGNRAGASIAHAFTRYDVDKFRSRGSGGFQVEKVFNIQKGLVLPKLVGDGVMRVIRCEVLGEGKGLLAVGDHFIVVGKVVDVLGGGDGSGEEVGLGYLGGRYRGPGKEIELKNV